MLRGYEIQAKIDFAARVAAGVYTAWQKRNQPRAGGNEGFALGDVGHLEIIGIVEVGLFCLFDLVGGYHASD